MYFSLHINIEEYLDIIYAVTKCQTGVHLTKNMFISRKLHILKSMRYLSLLRYIFKIGAPLLWLMVLGSIEYTLYCMAQFSCPAIICVDG